MARRRRFSRSWKGRYANVRKYGFRSSAKYAYKSGGGSIIFGLGGAVAGYAAPRLIPYQDTIMMAAACLPGVLPVGRTIPWQLRRFASGYVMGTIVKAFVPGLGGMGTNHDVNSDFA